MMWWPFRRRRKEREGAAKRRLPGKKMMVGIVIGGAIGSIVGKKLLDEHCKEDKQKTEKSE